MKRKGYKLQGRALALLPGLLCVLANSSPSLGPSFPVGDDTAADKHHYDSFCLLSWRGLVSEVVLGRKLVSGSSSGSCLLPLIPMRDNAAGRFCR